MAEETVLVSSQPDALMTNDTTSVNVISLITTNNNTDMVNANCTKAGAAPRKKEDEQITSAVMKVLQGYQWSLVQAPTK